MKVIHWTPKENKDSIIWRIGETTDQEDVYELNHERVMKIGYDIIKKKQRKSISRFF